MPYKNKKDNKKWEKEHKEERKEYHKNYYQKHRKETDERVKQWHKENPEKVNEWSRKYRREHKKETRERRKKYRQTHKKETNRYLMERRKKDFRYRLKKAISAQFYIVLKEKKASKHWESLVDYTLQDLIQRLEYQFDEKMNWGNYGNYWWIDHRKPQSLFHFNSAEEQAFKDCWCLANLQPMEKIENILKSNKF